MWDSFELNKIAGGVIAGILMLFLIDAIGGALIHPQTPEQAAYTPDGIEEFEIAAGGEAAAPKAKEPEVNALDLLAAADSAKGAKVFKKCAACHNVEPGGANGTGPALYGIVGQAKASAAGFAYSDALTGLGGTWDFAALDGFLANPKKYAKGTKMSFAGLKKPGDRAAVLAYLNENGASPLPLPAPSAPAAPEAPAVVEEAVEAAAEATEAVTEAAQETAEDVAETVEEAAEEAAQ
ncbi:MAG: c-type cytochrome [Alphaproteobacteria bacterium]